MGLVVNELIDSFYDRGQADLVREAPFKFPAEVIARILGLPDPIRQVPALDDGADQRGGQLGPWRGGVGGPS